MTGPTALHRRYSVYPYPKRGSNNDRHLHRYHRYLRPAIPEPRSLSDIEAQVDGARALQADAVNRLRAARSTFGTAAGGGASEAYLLSVQNEHLPQLKATEQEIVESIDRHPIALHEDRLTLLAIAWRPDAAIITSPTWSAQLAVAQSQLDSLPPDTLLGTIQSAILHRDRTQLAAFATLASRLGSRQDLSMWQRAGLDGMTSQCRSLVGDRRVLRLLADLDAARSELQDVRTDIVTVANSIEPGSVGSILDTYPFGTALGGQRPAAPLSRDALFRRAGAGPAS